MSRRNNNGFWLVVLLLIAFAVLVTVVYMLSKIFIVVGALLGVISVCLLIAGFIYKDINYMT
jgi:hypothetical protein